MKRSLSMLVHGALAFCLMNGTNMAAKEISAEQLVGEYSDNHQYDGQSSEPSVSLDKNRKLSVAINREAYLAKIKDGMLVLDREEILIEPEGRHRAIPYQFYIVQWGERIYLVRPAAMPGFVNEINEGVEPLSHSSPNYRFPGGHNAYLKWGDWDKKVVGDPDIPQEYKKFLLPKAASGKVSELAGDGKVWVDFGSNVGVLPGMMLNAHIPMEKFPNYKGRLEFSIQVLAVEKDRCLTQCPKSSFMELGWAVTSRRWD